jgi:hypothetical protein
MAATVLIHLNVTVPDGDPRNADQIADAILAAVEVGSDDYSVRDLTIVCPLAEAI